jgi:hypothetical protein
MSMAAVGRRGNERLAAQAQQIVVAHKAQHPLGIDDQALAPEAGGDAPIALVTIFERKLVDSITQIRIVARR